MSDRRTHRRTGAQTHRRAAATVVTLLLVLGASACTTLDNAIGTVPIFTTMRDQPNVRPFEMPRVPPAGSVPVTGREDSLDLLLELADLRNPVAPTPASLTRGRLIWGQYCIVCHGPEGRGDGTVVPKFVPPPDLMQETSKQRTDGYLYAMIRQGRGIMPRYGDKIRGADRWHVVNYLRQLQGMSPAVGGVR